MGQHINYGFYFLLSCVLNSFSLDMDKLFFLFVSTKLHLSCQIFKNRHLLLVYSMSEQWQKVFINLKNCFYFFISTFKTSDFRILETQKTDL